MTNGRVKGDLFVGNNVYANGEELATNTALTDGLAEKVPFSYGTATPTTSVDGFLWYDDNDTPPTPKFWDGAAFQALTSGKILQIVRATDTTVRNTTSTSYVDANISVTITPQKSTSAILIIWLLSGSHESTSNYSQYSITDSSNNAVPGAEGGYLGSGSTNNIYAQISIIGYSTPATTSATTYKGRFRVVSSGNNEIFNDEQTGQLYAIEVSA